MGTIQLLLLGLLSHRVLKDAVDQMNKVPSGVGYKCLELEMGDENENCGSLGVGIPWQRTKNSFWGCRT